MKHPDINTTKKVAVAGCKHTTKDFILGLKREGILIDHCVTISETLASRNEVSGYVNLRPFLKEENIPYTLPNSYSLKDGGDKEKILDLQIDMLLVIGWQRLIPEWWLEALTVGAFGMHGSNKPLPHGRGRSPMNWSLIQDKKLFFTHLFKYTPGVDDGDIVGRQIFDITPFDTALTMHHKNLLAMVKLCVEYLPSLLNDDVDFRPQESGLEPSYYPKRSPEDGIIFWEDATRDIYNLIRAVTKPFPGAFTYLDDKVENKLTIWRAIPFDTHLVWADAVPGEILEVFYDGTFLVKTGDTSLLVQEYEGCDIHYNHIGNRLGHIDRKRKDWGELPS